jgi:hypothetical protein
MALPDSVIRLPTEFPLALICSLFFQSFFCPIKNGYRTSVAQCLQVGLRSPVDLRAALPWNFRTRPGELIKLPGAELVNFYTERVKPWYVFGWSAGADLVRRDRFTVEAQLDIQNLADRPFAFNWASRFPGHTSDVRGSSWGQF